MTSHADLQTEQHRWIAGQCSPQSTSPWMDGLVCFPVFSSGSAQHMLYMSQDTVLVGCLG